MFYINHLIPQKFIICAAGLLFISNVLYAEDGCNFTQKMETPKDMNISSCQPFNYVIGTQTIGARYKFTDEPVLIETANQILAMGSNIIKFALVPENNEKISL